MPTPTTPADPCTRARGWLSAARDGEALDDVVARQHLDACADCTAWAERLDALTPRLRLRAAGTGPDVLGPALADWRARESAVPDRQTTAARILLGLAGVAAITLAIVGALGVGGSVASATGHIGWELQSFEAALGVGFLFAALRPDRYARSLLPVSAVAAALTLHPLVNDLSRAAVDPIREASHLPTVVALAALLLLVDAARRRDGYPPAEGAAGQQLHA